MGERKPKMSKTSEKGPEPQADAVLPPDDAKPENAPPAEPPPPPRLAPDSALLA